LNCVRLRLATTEKGGAPTVSGEHKHRTRPASDTAEETLDPAQPDEESIDHAAEASAKAADLIEGIDEEIDFAELVHESFVASLFEPGEKVTPEELDKRAERVSREYIQKGGQ
jgi:hypothetical protein